MKDYEVLRQLTTCIDACVPIIGVGAGAGISPKFEEAGSADLIVLYNSDRFQMIIEAHQRV